MRSASVGRILAALCIAWILVVTNPDSRSFAARELRFAQREPAREEICVSRAGISVCTRPRAAIPPLNAALRALFAPPPPPRKFGDDVLRFEAVDCAFFTIVRAIDPPHRVFLGVLGTWLPVPNTATVLTAPQIRRAGSVLREVFTMAVQPEPARFESVLPRRPWEWLLALFFAAGAAWFMFPDRASAHLTLTWENVRHTGHWWCMVFFHLSHGGSVLRLVRTVAAVNYLAPQLLARRIVTLSGLYGVVLTGSALSTALGMLVLARRYVFGSRSSQPRSALEINGGGGCVYALLVAACLSPAGYELLPGGVRPFELLMLNVAFDAFFLAGQKRIADYTAHAGAALGAWLFCSISALR